MMPSRRVWIGAVAAGAVAASLKPKPAEAVSNETVAEGFTGAINVASFGVVGNGIADHSAAIAAACKQAMAHFAAGNYCYLKFPSGNFYLNKTKLPMFTCPIGISGAGVHQTIFTIGTDYSGDVFSWSNCWMGDSYGASTMVRQLYAGVEVQDISFVGNLASPNPINALAFYNINDFVRVQSVDFTYIPGRSIYCGASNDSDGYGILRESRFNEIRIFRSGTTVYPCIEISSCGTSDGTNELVFGQIDIFYPHGHGFVIHNNGTEPVRLIKILGLRIEQVASGFNALQIGGGSFSGPIYGINALGLELVGCNAGSNAIALYGTAKSQVAGCYFQGQIVNCKGTGIRVNTGYGNKVVLLENASAMGLNITTTKFPFYYECAMTENGETMYIESGCQVYSPTYTLLASS